MSVRLHAVQAKKGIKKLKYPDPLYAHNYTCCPYAACSHNCAYCDGRAEKYFVQGEFDKDIVVRNNLPDLLNSELQKLREPGVIAMGSGITDVYQPPEKTQNLQAECLRALSGLSYGVSIQTKSELILRDIELLSAVHSSSGFIGMVTTTFADDVQRLIFEPSASGVENRFDILRQFRARGFYCGAFLMPLLPFVSADTDTFVTIMETLKEIGVDFAVPGLLTLRPGRQKEHFMKILRYSFPDLLPYYNRLYANETASGMPESSYCQKTYTRWSELQQQLGIPSLLPHRIYRRFYARYDEALLLLWHMQHLYESRGADISPLKAAVNNFLSWLKPRKDELFRKRKMAYRVIEDEFTNLLCDGSIKDILQNQKLGSFLQEGLLQGLSFDYKTLKWYKE